MAEALPFIMAGGQMAGGALSTIGQIQQADTYSRLADIDTRSILEEADLNNRLAAEAGRVTRQQGEYVSGEQTVAAAAGGIRADQGSPLLVAAQTARNTELDALTQEWQGQVGKVQASRQAELIQYDKKLKKRDATIGAIGTILGTGMNAGAGLVYSGAGGGGGAPRIGGRR